MNLKNKRSIRLRLFAVTLGVSAALGQVAIAETEPDNSKVNVRDQNPNALTSDDQTSKKEDVELIRKIRRSLTENHNLSTNAQNVKIISHNGYVILKGPVNSAQEKSSVERLARNVAGQDRVANGLSVLKQ